MRRSKYSVEVLRSVVTSSRSIAEVLRKLGLLPSGGNHRFITAKIRNARLDTAHFVGRKGSPYSKFDRADLEPLVRASISVAEVLAKLKLPTEGRPHYDLKRRIESLGIDTSHFKGRGWSRGQTAATHISLERISRVRRTPDDQLFVENSKVVNGKQIARRLLELGRPYACAWCGISEWRDTPLVLHLDHVNGIHNDNRVENLRFLCPNCHSQTPTYCGRKR